MSSTPREKLKAFHDQINRHLNEAEGYLMLNMPQRALEILERRTDWATMQFEASLIAGEALRGLERYGEAAKSLEVAAGLRPNEVQVAVSLAWCYKRTHRLAQAIATLEVARAHHPQEALLYYNLACYWCIAGSRVKALHSLSQGLEIMPKLVSLIPDESDFDSLRDDPEFHRLIAVNKGLLEE